MNTQCNIIFTFLSNSQAEIHSLKVGAIRDAQSAPQEEHLAYLQCYALKQPYKDFCINKINKSVAKTSSATWEYVRPYDHEAERLGFVVFTRLKNIEKQISDLHKFIDKKVG